MNNEFSTQNKNYEELQELKRQKINEWINELQTNNDEILWIQRSRVFSTGLYNIFSAMLKIKDDENTKKQYDLISTIGNYINQKDKNLVLKIVMQISNLDSNIEKKSDNINIDSFNSDLKNEDLKSNMITVNKIDYDRFKDFYDDYLKIRESEFFIKVNQGAVLPVMHPNYYNNRTIIKIYNEEDYLIQIDKEKYQIKTQNFYNKIKQAVIDNLDNLINNAKIQNSEYMRRYAYEGGQASSITIKYNKLYITLSGQVGGPIGDFCRTFIDYLKKIIIEDANKDYEDFLLEGLNNEPNQELDEVYYQKGINKSELIINKLIEKIKELPDNTEFTIGELLKDNSDITFKIALNTIKKAKEQGINIQSKFGPDAIVGLPQNVPYIKNSNIENK